ncbi:thioredoxin-disulfide reductase [Dissulfurirhabdus thermomarina]|uniref:Thioredoxin reductase n=1 Tax=Dissulfurirhabdus thermomarina TaxID=1765737 RepID=A0A6N9TMZ7_DISTH|nr:thioredoxin-disulfide reductase [Dissulfurirhabdus thermomarina]NDY41443.1 thioredoxin-disulfide reductase [Dissulfurirhabdus thermomarina]NMX24275.1 thioredoxin-disulfide reductase [Dissulfurirhabdus thermomarina]
MNAEKVHDLVIVGGGPGGLTAGIYAMRAALETVLVERGLAGGQVNNTDVVENWPGIERIPGAELAAAFARHAAAYGLEPLNREVTAVAPGLDHHEVHLDDGEVLRAHAVILATGGSPRKLGIPGEAEYYGKGVSYCATCDGFFFRDRTVVVVGGGDSAAEEALYLAKIARKVYLAHRRDALRASRILQQRVFAEPKIEVLWNTVLTAVKADASGVNAVDLQDTQTGERRELATDGVFVFIGFQPNNALVPAGVKMNAGGYVVTDERCATSIPGIYAVGDLREKSARQIVTAAADGCVAALAAAHYVEDRKAAAGA